MTAEELNAMRAGTMLDHLGIMITEVGDDFITAILPVDHRTKQPAGLLHGGATVVLAETLGSIAALMCIDVDNFYCVGIEVNANHLRAVRHGYVTGTARPLHIGRRTQVWRIEVFDDQDRLTAVSRLTLAVLDK